MSAQMVLCSGQGHGLSAQMALCSGQGQGLSAQMVLCSGQGHGLNTHKKRKAKMKSIGLLDSKGPQCQSFKPHRRNTQLQHCVSFQGQQTQARLPPYYQDLHSCSLPLTFVISFPFLPCFHCHFSFLLNVLPMALLNAYHHPLVFVCYSNCLLCTFPT